MLAERRDPTCGPVFLENSGSGGQPDGPLGSVDGNPTQMRMIREILDRVEVAKSNPGGFQALGE